MIVCHCNVITERAIRDVVDELIDADRFQVITPGLVYLTLGKRGRCCGCFPNAIEVIRSQVDARRGLVAAAGAALEPDDEATAA